MSSALKISEAVSIALHATALMAANSGRLISTREIACGLNVSGAHLSKVLQWLSVACIVASTRGPGGGSKLVRHPKKISLLNVYEAIEGKLSYNHCLFCTAICDRKKCVFGKLLCEVDDGVKKYLRRTKLADIASVYRPVPYKPKRRKPS